MQYICTHCGREFTDPPSSAREYCSRSCHNEARRKWYICKSCGVSYAPGPNGGPNYCGRECSAAARRMTRVEKTCEVCGRLFQIIVGKDQRACSMRCGRVLAQASNTGQRHVEYISLTCEYCGEGFQVPPGDKYNAKLDAYKKYCSRKCKGLSARGKWAIEDTRQVLITCLECGKELYCKPSEVKRKKYCSRECVGVSTVRRLRGRTATSIETAVTDALCTMGVDHTPQYRIGRWVVDVFIEGLNLVIECQGDFYHCNPSIFPDGPVSEIQHRTINRDVRKRADLASRGLRLLELWEHDIQQVGARALIEQYLNRQD